MGDEEKINISIRGTNNKSYSRIIWGINGRIHCHDIGGVQKKIALTESALFSFL
jgi:hypothetical protein